MTLTRAGVLNAERPPSSYKTSIALGLAACLIVAGTFSAYWLYGAVSTGEPLPFGGEQLMFQSVTCDKVVNASMTGGFYWTIMITFNSTGERDATIKNAFINGTEIDDNGEYYAVDGWKIDVYGVTYAVDNAYVTNMTTVTVIPMGKVVCIAFYLSAQHPAFNLTSGTTILITVHSSRGMDYPQLIELV